MIKVIPATLRDVSFIAANMRARDHEEIAGLSYHFNGEELARRCLIDPRFAFVAVEDGNPIAAFGVGEVTANNWQAWAFGTNRMTRAIPKMSDKGQEVIAAIKALGGNRIEARSHWRHTQAHSWLVRLFGARRVAVLTAYGREGDDYYLFERIMRK
jgi:hypothetical protein